MGFDDTMPPPVQARLLGPPEVEVHGEPLVVDTGKAVALLAYLVVEGSVSRDVAAALLWPSSDQVHARAALRRTLSTLRAGLARHAVSADRTWIRLEPREVTSDVALLLAATPDGDTDPDRLLALRRGPLLEGFTVRDAGPFEAWLRDTRRMLDRHLGRLLDAAIDTALADGRWRSAERWAEARLDVDPLHERTCRRLMWLSARRGDRNAAVARYRLCVARLRDELGVSPDPRTTSLYEALIAGRVPAPSRLEPPRSASSGLPSPARATAPLVGRDEILTAASMALADATTGSGLAVQGAAGMGKSRVLTEISRSALDAGRPVAATTAYRDEQRLPFASVIDLLSQLQPAPSAAVATIAPHLAPGTRPLDAGSRGRRASLIAGVWAALTSTPGTVLLVDDAHLVDASTLEVLTYGLRRLDRHQALVAVAYDPAAGGPLEAVVREASAHVLCCRLEPLDVHDIELLATQRRKEVDAAAVRARTGGLPLLVTAALDGRSARLDAAVDRLLGGHGGRALRVLSALAVAGRPIPPGVLAELTGLEPDATDHVLAWLTSAGTVRDTEEGYVLGQGLVRQAVLDRLGAVQRRALHDRLADHLAGRPGQEAVLAAHLQDAGRLAEAAVAHAAAARHAARLGSWEEAGHHLDEAIAAGHPHARELLRQRGDIDARRGRYQEAQEAYAAALAEASTREERALLEHRLGRLQLRRRAWRAARIHLLAAQQNLPAAQHDGVTGVEVMVDLALATWELGEVDAALAAARSALEAANHAADAHGVVVARNFLGLAERRAGDPRRAVEHLEAGLDLAAGRTDVRLALLNNLALALADLGATDEARARLEEAAMIARDRGDLHREAGVLNNLADLAHAVGETDEVRRLQREAVTRFALVGDTLPDPEVWRLVDW